MPSTLFSALVLRRLRRVLEGASVAGMEFSSAAAAVGLGLALDVVEEVLGVLAEIEGAGGRAEEGLSLLTKALTHVHKTGEQYYEAELYRLKRRTYFTKISSFAKSEGKGRP